MCIHVCMSLVVVLQCTIGFITAITCDGIVIRERMVPFQQHKLGLITCVQGRSYEYRKWRVISHGSDITGTHHVHMNGAYVLHIGLTSMLLAVEDFTLMTQLVFYQDFTYCQH